MNGKVQSIILDHIPGHNDQSTIDAMVRLFDQETARLRAAIDNQKAIIDRLLKHLEQHCPEFLTGPGKCDWMKEGSNG